MNPLGTRKSLDYWATNLGAKDTSTQYAHGLARVSAFRRMWSVVATPRGGGRLKEKTHINYLTMKDHNMFSYTQIIWCTCVYIYIHILYFLCFLLGFVPIISYELAEHNPKTSKKHVKKEPATKNKKSTNKKKQGNTYLGWSTSGFAEHMIP